MDLIHELTRERAMSVMLITPDLGMASQYCDRIVVMQKGRIVETGTADQVLNRPQATYTQTLVAAIPNITDFRIACE